MDFFRVVDHRHSYRGAFEEAAVPRESLKKMVQAGIQAPSGYNSQSTSFVIVDESDTVRRVLASIGDGVHLRTAPCAVVAVMNPDPTPDRDFSFGVQDCAAAVENVLLAAADLGFAAVWIEGALRRTGADKKIAEILGVPPPLEVRVVLPVGLPVEWKQQAEKKPFEDRAWFNRYGASGV